MNVESELKDIINRLYDIQDVSGPDLSKKIYEIILQCREAIGYRKAELDRVQSSRKPIKSSNLPEEVYYIVINGAKQYFEDREKAKEMAAELGVGSIHTETDPEEIQELYEVGYIGNSRKPIKSDSDWHARNDYQNKEIYREAFASLVKDSDAQDFDNSPYGTVHYPGFYRVLVDGTYETEFSAETDEEAIQKFKDYFAESRGINNSRKPIKSSLEDRLVPYLEEFEEGYADALTSTDEMGNNTRLDTFYEMFKSDYNLTDDDISKLEGAVQDIWHETEEDTEYDMGEMYGAPHGATPEEALKHFE